MPQTLTEIRQMLAEAGLRPQKMFGQNFLIDQNLLAALVELADPSPDDVVLEVGPGTGVLTDSLLQTGAAVLAVEIDRGMFELLSRRYATAIQAGRLALLNQDILAGKHQLNPVVLSRLEQLGTGCVKLVSNLPYNIATPLICECIIQSIAPHRTAYPGLRFGSITATIQKEAAQRLTAPVGQADYGPAAVLVSLFAQATLGKKLPGEAFWPRPNVHSRMIRLEINDSADADLRNPSVLNELLAWAFGQRRKKLGSSSRMKHCPFDPADLTEALARADIDLQARPDQIGPRQYLQAAQALDR